MTRVLETEAGHSFLEAAQKEMIAFERKVREFCKRAKQEEAEKLHLPLEMARLH
jgi:hypothetical protein